MHAPHVAEQGLVVVEPDAAARLILSGGARQRGGFRKQVIECVGVSVHLPGERCLLEQCVRVANAAERVPAGQAQLRELGVEPRLGDLLKMGDFALHRGQHLHIGGRVSIRHREASVDKVSNPAVDGRHGRGLCELLPHA